MLCSAAAIIFWAGALSVLGAITTRAAAALLRAPARFVIGVGPRLGSGTIEVRLVPIWIATAVDGRGVRPALVRATGPLAIVAVPFALVVLGLVVVGVTVVDDGPPAVAGAVVSGSPADEAGVEVGDVIVRAAERDHPSFADVVTVVREGGGSPVTLTVERGGERLVLTVSPTLVDGTPRIGIAAPTVRRFPGVLEASDATLRTIAAVWRTLAQLASGSADGAVVGPVEMARIASESPRDAALQLGVTIASSAPIFALLAAIQQIVWSLRRARARAP